MKTVPKVLFVATSRETMGGISSVLRRYERMPFWAKYSCDWLETQVNKNIALKLKYIIRAYIRMLYVVPKFDIIHFHTIPGRSVLMQLPIFLYSLLWRKKTITHVHVGTQLKESKKCVFFGFVLRYSTKVVVLAKSIKQILQLKYGTGSDVVYNPIEQQPSRDESKVEKLIFFAALLRPFKGYSTVLHAFAKVVSLKPEWRLTIAGSGDVNEVKKIICDLGIIDNVNFLPWCSQDEMMRLYRKSAIFCIASKKEGFPMTFLEAASHGLAIVTTPVGGLIDVLEHESNSLVFDFDDENQLAINFIRLIENPCLRQHVSAGARKLIESTFSCERVNQSLDDLYSIL